MFKILLKASTGAILLINRNSPDLFDYYGQGFEDIPIAGTKTACLKWVEDYWDENYVPDDEKIFLTVS